MAKSRVCKVISRTLLFIAVAFPLATTLTTATALASDSCDIVPRALEDAIRIRGLEKKESVRCKSLNKEEVKKYLTETIDTKIPAERLELEEWLYKAIRFIPDDFSYRQGLLDLYLSQLGGFYDPVQKYFAIASWMPASLNYPIAVHELTHALQDQHFNLEKFIDRDDFTTDQLLARSALIEGDATAVMFDHLVRSAGARPLGEMENIAPFIAQGVLGVAFADGLDGVPRGLVQALLFPYMGGLRYVHNLLRQGGYSEVTEKLAAPPNSTSEILHPTRDNPVEIKAWSNSELLERAGLNEKQEVEFEDSLGEFLISTLLSECIQDPVASSLVSSWRGDRLLVLRIDEKPSSSVESADSKDKPSQSANSVETKDARKLLWISNWHDGADKIEALFNRCYGKPTASEPQAASRGKEEVKSEPHNWARTVSRPSVNEILITVTNYDNLAAKE
jgi:hypothetical protein